MHRRGYRHSTSLAFAARCGYGGPVHPTAAGGRELLTTDELADWHAVISCVLGTLCTFTEEQLQSIGLPVAYVGEPTKTMVGGFEISNTVLIRMQHEFGRDEHPKAQRDEL